MRYLGWDLHHVKGIGQYYVDVLQHHVSPGLHHFQYLISYSMQIWKAKACETWSHVMMYGTQRVDTQRVVPDKRSHSHNL